MPRIRVANATGTDLEAVRVDLPGEPREAVDFGAVPNGGRSDHRAVPVAYRYMPMEVSGPAGTFTIQPYDYVGEQQLPEGDYTYRLGLVQSRLTLDLEQDAPEEP